MRASPSNLRTPVIHIGMPKTATKTLQWHLFNGHSEIYYLGRFDGTHLRQEYKKFDCCRNVAVQGLMKQIAYGNVENPDVSKCKELLTEILEPARAGNLVPVWSWESYATDALEKNQRRARHLKTVFESAKIFITIRNPLDLIESTYFQQLRSDSRRSIRKLKIFPYYQPIDKWLEDNFQGVVLNHLLYAETIQIYIELFGRDNVYVFMFEGLKDNPSLFFGNICEAMNIDASEGFQLCRKKVENERWTTKQIEELMETTALLTKKLSYTFSSENRRRRLLGITEGGGEFNSGEKARAEISPEWQEKIFNLTRQGNLWLQNNFDLPLDEHGYYKK